MTVAAKALEAVEASGERFYAAELHRQQGTLLLAIGHDGADAGSVPRNRDGNRAASKSAQALERRARANLERI